MSKVIRDIGQLTLEERAGLEAQLRNKRARNPQGPIIPRHPDSDRLPLSFSQQRLWLLAQLEPDSPAYNITAGIRLTGPLNVAALEQSLDEIIKRHVVLRTNFTAIDGQPIQFVSAASFFILERTDLSALPEDEREIAVEQLARESAATPFDLSRGSLLRAMLLELREQEHVVLLTIHHIIFDAWSMGVLVSELSALYEAFCSGASSPLPELPIQYIDFAQWQREWLQAEVLEKQLSYWRQQLNGAPAMLKLPFTRPRPPIQTDRGASHSILLPTTLSEALQSLSHKEGVTLFMTLLAAFNTLLYRYTGEEDAVVGTAVAGRNSRQVEPLIGFFVNTLVLRTDLSGDPRFCELLARVRKTALEAYAHQDVPFELLVSVLQPERSLSRTPLFQVMFTLQNARRSELALTDLTLNPIAIERGVAKFDLELIMSENEEGLAAYFEYNTDLFDASSIECLARHFQTLLESIVADPGRPLSTLALLSASERRQILYDWNDTKVEVPFENCFPQLFEAQVARCPNAIAVVYEEQQLTYAELNQLANRLAWSLVEQGVGAETLVSLLGERDLNLLVAILAVFKAGGAYLPLEPHHPPKRMGQILQRSKSPLVLTTKQTAALIEEVCATLPDEKQPVTLLIEPLLEQQQAFENLPPRCTPDQLAYVIYTSGSSGQPKGAMVEHRGMLNHLLAKVSDLSLSAGDRVAQTASQCFDISVWQYLAILLVGGTVEIITDDVAHDPRRLLEQVREQRISVLETVPSLLRELVRTERAEEHLESLRWLVVTGEALAADLVREWQKRQPQVGVINAYGPTECSDDVTHEVVTELGEHEQWVAIGKAVRNTRLYVLDEQMGVVPIGVTGELYIGGEGVGRGYLGRAELTAERFVPDPYSSSGGERLYRTGDEVKWRESGALEFIDRVDNQVKVRGYRIELGEIEAVLGRHEMVRECVVVARETESEKQLVAYIVVTLPSDVSLTGTEEVTSEKVRQWQEVFDQVYLQPGYSAQDQSLNLRVWTSSYTGQPLAEAEIFECLEDTTARLLALRPRRVLEIGCGTGLLLWRLAPHCEYYCGTDISAGALQKLRERLSVSEGEMPHVELLQRGAEELEGIGAEEFDLVVLNEVVQYFPSVKYLAGVLGEAVKKARPGGAVFVGGVRRLELLEAFHSSVQLAQAGAGVSANELRQRLSKQMRQEKELVVSEQLFRELGESLAEVDAVEVELKGGRWRNELTKYRYDVVLRMNGDEKRAGFEATEQRWNWREVSELEELKRRLERERPEIVRWAGVENARVVEDLEVLKLLWSAGKEELTAEKVRREAQELARGRGVEPSEVREVCEGQGYEVQVEWSGREAVGAYDVVLKRRGVQQQRSSAREENENGRRQRNGVVWKEGWAQYGNSPLRVEERVVPELRRYLQERLPEYMIPAAFVMLDKLPLTANGKVDRKGLPAPEQHRPELDHSFVAPRTQTEELLAGIWCEVLKIERIGVNDNFFELGGHSLLATQVISRVRQAFKIELPFRRMFEVPTVAGLAAVISENGNAPDDEPLSAIKQLHPEDDEAELLQLDLLSDEQVDSLLSRMLAEEEAHQ
jgi:amino acid adenylation domain-containing protein